MWFVIVFPDHTHLLFFAIRLRDYKTFHAQLKCLPDCNAEKYFKLLDDVLSC